MDRTLLFFVLICISSVFLLQEAKASSCTLIIDTSAIKKPASFKASGFLYGISYFEPSKELVESLKPKLFRTSVTDCGFLDQQGIYERAAAMGAKVQVDLGSAYGCPPDGPCPGDNGDWSGWDSVIDYLLSLQKEKGYQVQWDIWNEPNLEKFWSKDYDRYLELWLRTVKKIRSTNPNAEIVGPSICGYEAEWLQRFLLWARDNYVLPDIISWHEFDDPRKIPLHIAELRDFLKKNNININRFSLNEIISEQHLTKPGPTAIFLWAIEQADIESAAHACWEDEQKDVFYGCFNNSLDGILTIQDKKPRSTWWVYRRYADVTGNLLQVDECESIKAIAARDDSKKQIAILIGNMSDQKLDVHIRFRNINRMWVFRDEVRVKVEHIPDLGWKHLPKPKIILDKVCPIIGGNLTISIPKLGPTDAYFVLISAK